MDACLWDGRLVHSSSLRLSSPNLSLSFYLNLNLKNMNYEVLLNQLILLLLPLLRLLL